MLALKQPVNIISLVPPQVDGQPVDLDEQLAETSQPLSLPIYLLGAVRNARGLKVTDPLDQVYGMLNYRLPAWRYRHRLQKIPSRSLHGRRKIHSNQIPLLAIPPIYPSPTER